MKEIYFDESINENCFPDNICPIYGVIKSDCCRKEGPTGPTA